MNQTNVGLFTTSAKTNQIAEFPFQLTIIIGCYQFVTNFRGSVCDIRHTSFPVMFLSISLSDSLIWAMYILLWSGCFLGLLATLKIAKATQWIHTFSTKTLAILSVILILSSTFGIYAFEEKLIHASASGEWKFGDDGKNLLRIDCHGSTYQIKESNTKSFIGKITALTKDNSTNHYYLYLLGYPNEMSSTMVTFAPLHSPKIHLKNGVVPCK